MRRSSIDIYDPKYVAQLFDEMAQSYEWVNYITSFGFSKRWRRQCVAQANLQPHSVVYDLMCGMGECWHNITKRIANTGQLLTIDLSSKMLRAARRRRRSADLPIFILQQDMLMNGLGDRSADHVVSAFGLKTFSREQQQVFACELMRILKPGGTFSLVEVSVPRFAPLRLLYMFYLKQIIPRIGLLFLGNPDNYRMLGVYTERFGNAQLMYELLKTAGFQATYHEYFFGCATGVSGVKDL
jgi:ubiquinone/menaquinone biosynthesis methyltransferase